MSAEKYNKAAYRATVWKEAARLLREKYFPEAATPPELPCESAFRAAPVVPSEIIQEVIISLQKAVRQEEDSMMRFKLAEIRDDEIRTLTGDAKKVRQGGGNPTKRDSGKPKQGSGQAPEGA